MPPKKGNKLSKKTVGKPKKPTLKSVKAKQFPSSKKTLKKQNHPEQINQEKAAVIIQKNVKRYLLRNNLKELREKRQKYENEMSRLQEEAYAAAAKAEQARFLREAKEEEEKRKKELAKEKRVKRMLEAAFDGDYDEIKAIVKEVEAADNEARIGRNEVGMITRKLHMMEIVECTDKNNYSALSEASAGGNTDSIKFLIDRGADVNSIGAYGRSPLYRAAFAGHLSAVQVLLQHGADPRIISHDQNTAAEVCSIPEIVDILENWDTKVTDEFLKNMSKEKEIRDNEVRKKKEFETKKIENDIESASKESDRLEKVLYKAYCELEKRINEHDTMVAEGNDKMAAVTLKTVKQAEIDLEEAKEEAMEAKQNVERIRLILRDQQNKTDDLPGVKCNLRELEEVLFQDVGDRIKSSGKWPLLIDESGQAATFLKYRDTNYICAINPSQMQPEVLRIALLGSIRFGKPLVLDLIEVCGMFDNVVVEIFDRIQKKLLQDLITMKLLEKESYMKLVKKTDDSAYQPSNFMHHFTSKFKFILLTKNSFPQNTLLDKFYTIRVVLSKKN